MIALKETPVADIGQQQHDIQDLLTRSVTEAVDRGITRIKRNNIVMDIVVKLLQYAACNSALEKEGKQETFDTNVCRIVVTFCGAHKYSISIEGNDELSQAIKISCDGKAILVNGFPLEFQSIVVMVTSLLLKNSQDLSGQIVEVFAKS